MAKITIPDTTLKRLRGRYRLVVMNDDTYTEVVTFKLSRTSVYIGMSVVFVLLIGLTVALLSFTNLKYLIPGYGKQGSLATLRALQIRADSLEQALIVNQQYLDGIKKALNDDNTSIPLDTTILQLPKTETVHE